MQVVSFNAAGAIPTVQDILPVFASNLRSADIVIVGLQEIIVASFGSTVGNFFTGKADENLLVW